MSGHVTSTTRLRVIFVRHGESTNNVHAAAGQEAYTANRVSDPDLSERGKEQARRVGALLADPASAETFLGSGAAISEVWVSPHKRTLATAAPLAEELVRSRDLPPRVVVATELFEAGGIFDESGPDGAAVALRGLTRTEMTAGWPTYALPPDVDDSGWYHEAGRESNGACRSRCASLVARLRARALALTADENIIAVTHDYTSCALLEALFPDTTSSGDPPLSLADPHRKFTAWRHYNTGFVFHR